jgi:electron transport complex protein RnfE
MSQLFGPSAQAWQLDLLTEDWQIRLLSLPPGAFLAAGLLLAGANALINRISRSSTEQTESTGDDAPQNQGQT